MHRLLLILGTILSLNTYAQIEETPISTPERPPTTTIGTQTWTTSNLNVDHFRNGDVIPEVTTHEQWQKAWNEGKAAPSAAGSQLADGTPLQSPAVSDERDVDRDLDASTPAGRQRVQVSIEIKRILPLEANFALADTTIDVTGLASPPEEATELQPGVYRLATRCFCERQANGWHVTGFQFLRNGG